MSRVLSKTFICDTLIVSQIITLKSAIGISHSPCIVILSMSEESEKGLKPSLSRCIGFVAKPKMPLSQSMGFVAKSLQLLGQKFKLGAYSRGHRGRKTLMLSTNGEWISTCLNILLQQILCGQTLATNLMLNYFQQIKAHQIVRIQGCKKDNLPVMRAALLGAHFGWL